MISSRKETNHNVLPPSIEVGQGCSNTLFCVACDGLTLSGTKYTAVATFLPSM